MNTVTSPRVTLTKAELVDAVYDKIGGFSKKEATDIVDEVFKVLKEQLEASSNALSEQLNLITAVKISGFGNFMVRYKRLRMGRNPQTGEPLPIPARKVLRFRPSPILKDALNPER